MKLPIGQIGFILAVVITIIRKNHVVGGERLSNVSLKAKVDSWQRIIRAFFAEEDVEKAIHVHFSEPRCPDLGLTQLTTPALVDNTR